MQKKMACELLIWGLLMLNIPTLLVASEDDALEYMSKEEREALKFVLIYKNKDIYKKK